MRVFYLTTFSPACRWVGPLKDRWLPSRLGKRGLEEEVCCWSQIHQRMVARPPGRPPLPRRFLLSYSHAARAMFNCRRYRSGLASNCSRVGHQALPIIHPRSDERIVTAAQSVQSESRNRSLKRLLVLLQRSPGWDKGEHESSQVVWASVVRDRSLVVRRIASGFSILSLDTPSSSKLPSQ